MTRPSDHTREAIIKAAVHLFAEKGFDSTSVRDIVTKARVNQAAINYHFKTKDGLYLEVQLVRPIPAVSTSVSAPQTAQLNPQPLNQRESTEVSLDQGQVDGPATNELRANSAARLAVVAASAEVGTSPKFALKTAVAPSPAAQKHSTQVAQRARHKEAVSSSRQAQHSLAPQDAPNVVDRFFAGVTAAFEHVWPPQS